MDDPRIPDEPLPVFIKQKLVFDCFQLEPKSELAGETPYDNSYLEKEVRGDLHYEKLFNDSKVKQALEAIENKMPLKIKLPSIAGKRDLYASILVPEIVFRSGGTCPVHVRFHGGGFVSITRVLERSGR